MVPSPEAKSKRSKKMNNEVEVKSAKVQELEAVAAKCLEPVKARRSEIGQKVEEILTAAVGKSGVKGVAVKMRDAVDRAEVVWLAHDFERFEITFAEEWCGDDIKRVLKVGMGSYGNFDKSEEGQIALHICLGSICAQMREIEAKLAALDWKGLAEAQAVYRDACREVNEQKQAEKVAADNAKCAEAEAQLAAGKFLKYGRNGSNQYYLIEKITPKCVFLKWERNDKAQVIREIVSGKCEVVSAEVAETARAAGQYVRG